MSSVGLSLCTPALVTTMSIPPNRVTADLNISPTAASSPVSAFAANHCAPDPSRARPISAIASSLLR